MRRRLEDSEFFDAAWYLGQYDDVSQLGMSPEQHYLDIGASLLRDPGPRFSTAFYLTEHPDVAAAGVNPLLHFLTNGLDEGRRIAPAGWRRTLPAPERPVPLLSATPIEERPARVVSFYLPQFHAVPENDEWWGEGFTEWTNVRPASPQFPGHYQPHVPGELGYYDLTDTEVQRRQIELAKVYGVEAFCFYFYWFAGHRLLETPVRNYLDDPTLELPFMLCWANENWSRRWDGKEDDVLIAQEHSAEDDLAFIEHIAPYLRDPRYVRVDGRPMLLVYRPRLLPDPAATALRWREWCRVNGIGEIHLAYTQSFESADPRDYGFDAAIEFPPNNTGVPNITKQVRSFPKFTGNIYDWNRLVDRSMAYSSPAYPLYRGVTPSWDNTARRGDNGTVLWNSSPGRFTKWLTNAIRDTELRFSSPDERFVFVNAWNEWAEGAHLEPDQRYGYAWLESVRVALASATRLSPVAHDACPVVYVDATGVQGVPALDSYLQPLVDRHRVILAVRPEQVEQLSAPAGLEWHVCDHGMGKLGLLELFPSLVEEGLELVLSIDAATLPTDDAAARLLDPSVLGDLVLRFASDPELGVVSAPSSRLEPELPPTEGIVELADRLGLGDDDVAEHARWSGAAFCIRTRALAPLAALAFADDELSPISLNRRVGLDADLARAMAVSAHAMGLRSIDLGAAAPERGRPGVVVVSHDAHPHGAQRLALNLAKRYVELGFVVDIVLLEGGSLLGLFEQVAPVHVVDLTNDSGGVLRLLRALKRKGRSFALVNTTVSGRVVPLLKRAGFPVISLVHEMPSVLAAYDLQHEASLIHRHADAVVFPASMVLGGFEEFLGQRLPQARVRPQGLYLRNPRTGEEERASRRAAIRAVHGLSPDARILLAVGYADHRKGVDLFAEACVGVLAANDDATALWVGHQGDPVLIAEVDDMLTRAGVRDRFLFVGLVDNPQDYYTAADVFLLTSREDPFPSVVLEAMDARVPVIAFRGVTGSEEVIRRGGGLLVDPFDTAGMAAAASAYLDDAEAAAETGRAGCELVEREFQFRDYVVALADLAGVGFPKVSVVVPNYNYEQYIRARLDTVLAQTVPLHELIVLDDASTDASVDVVSEFAASSAVPVDTVVNEENSGSVFHQWLRGVGRATGEFVWIAEADDLADPEFLEEVLSAFDDPDVVMSYAQSRQMAGDGSILCEHYLDYVSDIDPARWTSAYVAAGLDEIREALSVKNTVPNVSAVVFRRDALLKTLREHTDEILSYRFAGDWVAYLRLLELGKVAFTSRSLNSHRRHSNSVTLGSLNVDQLREIVAVQQSVIQRHGLGKEYAERAGRYAQVLFEQFGLASDEWPEYSDHPELAPLISS